MTNKIILITGATDGIGKQTAIELAKKNSMLILHGRNADNLEKIKEEIFYLSGNNKLDFFLLIFLHWTRYVILLKKLNPNMTGWTC